MEECYICGLIDNEALLGPLPRQFPFLWLIDENYGLFEGFINFETGEKVLDDPRLDSFPSGWWKSSREAERVFPFL